MERMTLHDPPDSKIASLKKTVFFQCLNEIRRTGGIKPACRREHRRYEFLIEPYDQDHYSLHISTSNPAQAGMFHSPAKRCFYLRTFRAVDLIAGNDDKIISHRKFSLQGYKGLPKQPSRPVSLHAVANLLAGQKCSPVIAEPVLNKKQHDIMISDGLSLPVDPTEIFLIS